MTWSLTFSPYVPWAVLIGLGVVAFAIAVLFFWRRQSGAVLRLAGLATLLLALANPTLKQEEREFLSNIAVAVVDVSASQTIAERTVQAANARAALEERLGEIRNLEIRVVEAGRTTDDGRSGTLLVGELEQAVSDIPSDRLAGVVIVTDGQVHDVPKTFAALDPSVPVHALLTGAPGEFDRRIKVLKAPRYGIVGSETEVRVTVEVQGRGDRQSAASNAPARLRVRREGVPDERITARPGEEVVVDFAFPHAGTNIIELDLEAVDGELTTANNRMVISAQGVRENLRVLLVSGEPHAGERTWRNLLKSDAAVDLVHFTILRPPEKQDGTPINQLSLIAFPTRELFSEKLHDFDLVIFDKYQQRGVLPLIYLQNITRYVEEHGGAVLVAAGEDYAEPLSLYMTPLADVLPAAPTGRVIERPFKPQITDLGRRHPVTRDLPGAAPRPADGSAPVDPSWGRWFRLIETDRPRGQTIMEGSEEKPLLVLDRRGKGRVALLLSDHAWLWARGLEGGGPHTTLLRRLGHWLMKEPDLEEEFLSAKRSGDTLEIERRTMKDAVPPVEVLAPDGGTQAVTLREVEPGTWRGTAKATGLGLYKLSSDGLTAVARVGAPNAKELAEVTATAEKLSEPITASGGGTFWLARAGADDATAITMPRVSMLRSANVMHGNGWMGLRDRRAFLTRGVRLYPLFNGFLALAALLLLISAMWWREGR
ncbi:MAG: hypothetical protein AAFQ42_03170 [Pseudomonadota bacterium]